MVYLSFERYNWPLIPLFFNMQCFVTTVGARNGKQNQQKVHTF